MTLYHAEVNKYNLIRACIGIYYSAKISYIKYESVNKLPS
jgi:hypothetical protein